MNFPARRLSVVFISLFSVLAAQAQTAQEILDRSAQAITRATTFTGRGWGYNHVITSANPAGRSPSATLYAYDAAYRAPSDWMLAKHISRQMMGNSPFGNQQTYAYSLGTGTVGRGGWRVGGQRFDSPVQGGTVDPVREIAPLRSFDPFCVALQYWFGGRSADFSWGLQDVALRPDERLGNEPVWHVVGRSGRQTQSESTDEAPPDPRMTVREVHLWFSREGCTLVRSVVVDRNKEDIRRIGEFYYDLSLDAGALSESALTNPKPSAFGDVLSIDVLGLTEPGKLVADFSESTLPDSATASTAQSGTPAPPATSPASTQVVGQQLSAEQMGAIVIIEGKDGGQATGFLTKLKGVDFIVTNLHVLGSDAQLTARTLNDATVPVQAIFGAVGRDVAILRTAPATQTLEIADDLVANVKIGDEVAVVGNRRGGRVATQVTGKILGIGPAQIEVDAQFEPGNSGSPVVHLKTGKVIGVASYSEKREVEDDSAGGARGRSTPTKIEQRWFAYRVDGVSQWESIDPSRWAVQYKQISEFCEDSEALYALARADLNSGKSSPRIRPYVESFEERFQRFASNSPGLVSEMQNFLGNLRGRGQSGVRELKNGQFYDYYRSSLYWRTSIKEQLEFREWILDRLDRMTRNVNGWQAQVRSGRGG